MGMAGQEPPSTRAEMFHWAEEFTPPHVLAALRMAEPVGEVARHRVPSSQWRRYDKMRRLPDGLLVVGDAICSFNPIYGQGMTVAALEALALRDCLSHGEKDLARRFFRAAVKPIRQAWQLSAGGDLALPEIDGEQSLLTKLFNGYVGRVLTAAEYDTAAMDQFSRGDQSPRPGDPAAASGDDVARRCRELSATASCRLGHGGGAFGAERCRHGSVAICE